MIKIRGELVEIINSKEGRIRPPLNEKTDGIVIVSSQSLAEQLSQQGCIIGKAKDEIIIHIPAPQEKEVGELTIIKGILRTINELSINISDYLKKQEG